MRRIPINLGPVFALAFLLAGCGGYFDSQQDSKHSEFQGKIDADAYQVSFLKPLEGLDLPLATKGQWIVDKMGKRLKLSSVNWYGASDAYHVVMGLNKAPIDSIISQIKKIGFNSVRLPFSNEMLHEEGPVSFEHLTKNPQLRGMSPLEIFDAVISALTNKGLLVILNNHTTIGKWCCNGNDGNGLWMNKQQSTLKWMHDWEFLIERYQQNPMVIGADLRNEVRDDDPYKANWGKGGPFDFHRVSEELGNRLLGINPDLLIVIEGLHFSTNFSSFDYTPIQLIYPNRVVFSPHIYSWSTLPGKKSFGAYRDYESFAATVNVMLKPLFKNGKPTAPIWFGEWGYSQDSLRANDTFPRFIHRFLEEHDLDWSWWPLNVGQKPASNDYESWGLLEDNWQQVKENDPRIAKIKELIH
ncbi:MAG: cellulase family glycosylhydrolase [Oligoflexales bacterium]|nr:cellulase family glycosylhydrolase [Oligoflexales bacterium]